MDKALVADSRDDEESSDTLEYDSKDEREDERDDEREGIDFDKDGVKTYYELESYNPQPSKRALMHNIHPHPDNDTWLEVIVLLKKDRKTKIRPQKSLFYSMNTKLAYWDEPLSGASRIILSKSDAAHPFNLDKYEKYKDVYLEIVVSTRRSKETRSLFYSLKTNIAHWDHAPRKAKVIFTDFGRKEIDNFYGREEDEDDISLYSI